MRGLNMALLAVLLVSAWAAYGQYPVSLPSRDDQVDSLEVDTTAADSLRAPAPAAVSEEAQTAAMLSKVQADAQKWVRRLLYRGYFDDEDSGVSAVYALTAWKESSGPYGPVLAHVTVTYLGAVSWLGNPAAWIQATYRSFEPGRPTVDFDIIVGTGEKLGDVYRGLWRVNKDELSAVNFKIPPGELDVDRQDQPRSEEQMELKLYAGTFPVTVYRGSGTEGEKVVAYRGAEIPPLSLVRLCYGTYCLNLRDRASDVEPKLQVPLPVTR
ncbi:MAG: hypothetical protein IPG71_05440 [bacterium]|nr:hypothetical protein [bacterium]